MTVNAAIRADSKSDARREPHLQICTTSRTGLAAHLEGLSHCALKLRCHRNEAIFDEHDAATHIYYVAAGCVRLCRHVADGRRHIAEFMFAGGIFGLGEYQEYPYAAEAVNNVTVIAYPRTAVEELEQRDGRIRTELMAHFSVMLASARERLFRSSCQSARERTASFILQMWEQDQIVYGDRIDLPMGRQEIADHLGLTIETICRSLASLRAAGLIEIPNAHQIVMKRPDELRAILEGQYSY